SLLATTRDINDGVALAARTALVGWDDPRIHLLFLDLLEERESVEVVTEHLNAIGEDLGPLGMDRLRGIVGGLYVSEDWRNAARAQPLIGVLDTERAAPLLIEALTLWGRRAESGKGSARITEEIVVELRRLSGRGMGNKPAQWNAWWAAVLRGDVLLPETSLARGAPMTTAAFFGLRLASDRVLFVVDRSGSMERIIGTGGQSRYEEAVDQIFYFLAQAGSDASFALALFHDNAETWRTGRLMESSDSVLKQARRWLEAKRPKGGTNLRTGLFNALGGDRRGQVKADHLDVDTVVVLCDGATASGAGWVQDWIEATQEDLQLIIHGVQIGSHGDGTLEALAEGTGGKFIRVDG
ncbi:MAG: hypothetical protein ACI8PQ_002300, partial [Planctomycetota bacterium]